MILPGNLKMPKFSPLLVGFSSANRVLVSRSADSQTASIDHKGVAGDVAKPSSVCPKEHEASVLFQVADAAMSFAWLIHIVVPEGRPPIFFNLDPDWVPNAYANAVQGTNKRPAYYNSTVTAGLLANLVLLTSAVLSDQQTLQDVGVVGSPIADTSWLSNIDWGADLSNEVSEIQRRLDPAMLSFDSVRKSFLLESCQYAIWFVMQHEWAHIYLGHLDWLIFNGKGRCLAESANSHTSRSLTDHAMENQADGCAAVAMLRNSTPELARCTGFGVGVMMSLFASEAPLESMDSADHPHTTTRATTLANLAIANEQEIADDLRPAWLDGFREAVSALARATISDAFSCAIVSELGERSVEQISDSLLDRINDRNRGTRERSIELNKEIRLIDWWIE